MSVRVLLAVAVAALAAFLSGQVRADAPVLPTTDSLPWTDPAHQSALEVLDSQIASEIAKRPVRSYCNGENDWNALGASREFDPNGIGGFVDPPHYYYPTSRIFYDSSVNEQLSPRACWYLWQYGMAATKPTKCQTFTTQTATIQETVTYTENVRRRVKVRVKVKGRWVTRWRSVTQKVTKTKQVPKTITTQVPGPPVPCYGLANAAPAVGWAEYDKYAMGMLVLAHESVHLYDLTAGRPIDLPFEARAECFGMQWLVYVATKLGAAADDARSIATYVLEKIYPRYQGTRYWSADCRQDGPLDLSPGDGVWP